MTALDPKPGFTPETVQAVLDAGGTLAKGQALRCRVRYFSDGANGPKQTRFLTHPD